MSNELIEQVKQIEIAEYNYSLPDERIAQYPLEQRDASKLLVWEKGNIRDERFVELGNHIPADSLLIFNNTKVIQARLHFQKSTGAKIEIFCLDPVQPTDYALNFAQRTECTWKCIVGNSKKWKSGLLSKPLTIDGKQVTLNAERLEANPGESIIRFSWDGEVSFSEVIEAAGIIPIPPYLNRDTEQSDLERYQTVFSKIKGSVAAPTAGLHFTEKVFETFEAKNIRRAEVTLHVGAGTFKPVKSDTIDGHDMHTEHILVKRQLIETLLKQEAPIIAVGTTSIRTIESLFWMGVKTMQNPDIDPTELHITQWTPYLQPCKVTKNDALSALLSYMDKHQLDIIDSSTQIIIAPGYTFRVMSGMITNFHQPQSTLLLLISAFLGDEWKTIYQHALANEYRFLSYGDSNLYLK
ncbi:S-adenosylmethionine:tRNA ribosyltransferase-isomerase [Prolixibacteraceae bacterium JC049]|nr:S-adenosylmethionine:tRNA ribosyltransferase-isomerase [Prolixibacteraceae bacterium JC049]